MTSILSPRERRDRRSRRPSGLWTILLLLSASPGCTVTGIGGGNGNINANDNTAGNDNANDNNGGGGTNAKDERNEEPNDSFETAVNATDAGGRLSGEVAQRNDIDVFLLGAVSAGDRVTVDTDTTALDSVLDVSIALYDDRFRLLNNNDDRTASDLDAIMTHTFRHDTDAAYLVVTHSAFAARGTFTGAYEVNVTTERDVEIPAPQAQALLLDFDGATVDSATLGMQVIVPFDAGAISSAYEGQTARLKTLIVQSMEENFEGFQIDIWTTDDPPPAGTMVSTIHLGGFDTQTYGIAESVDLYNLNRCDDAIIYTESFSPEQFSSFPTLAEMAVGIGNVTAHEAGHLLGLNHVDDDRALMDDRSIADALLDDQDFMEAPVSTDIIPIGVQDAVFLLADIVGLR